MAKTNSQDLRKARVRKALAARGALRPRLSVFRSSKNIYAQVIDDAKGVTVAAASSLEKDLKARSRPAPTRRPPSPSASSSPSVR